MSQSIDTIIRFSGLKSGRYNFHFNLDREFFEGFENDEIKDGNVQFDILLERLERTLMFSFDFKGEVIVLCDRCLSEMNVPIEGQEKLCVKFSDTDTTDDEDVAILPEGAFEIDLAQWLYEYVAVRIPMQHMHPEGECDPATVKFIADENVEKENEEIDPRWEALKQLKINK